MKIDIKVLNGCPELTDYEKDLILRVDVKGESQASVAKFYGKSPATISIQHKKALAKFNAWLKGNKEQEEKPSVEDFDKQVFKMRNKGVPANKIVEKLGNAERVLKLCKLHRMLMEDDYQHSLKKITEYGLEPDEDSKHPLSDQIDYLIGENYVLSEEKKEVWNWLEENGFTKGLEYDAYGSVNDAFKRFLELVREEMMKKEALERRVNELEEQQEAKSIELKAAKAEIRRLEPLKKYEDLTDEQIQERRENLRRLEKEKEDFEIQLSRLNLQIDKQKEILFDLYTKTREMVKAFLAKMDINDIRKLVIEAKWVKTNPFIAKILKSQL